MTWILPKQLISAYALATEELISDSEEQSRICAQSLFLRSKVSPARTWSAKWRRDSWTAHLSGRILKLSLGERFLAEWTSSLAVTHASHLVPPGSVSAQTIPDTSGHSSQTEFDFFDRDSASLRMSKDTSVSASEMSLANWNQWVTRCRGEYSLRVNAARLTNANECLSWPTATARDWKDGTAQSCQNVPANGLLGRVVHQNISTHGNRPELWATPRAEMDSGACPSGVKRGDLCSQAGGVLNARLDRNFNGPPSRLDYAKLCVTCDNRTDELRLLGNGVVPATATLAFQTLLAELLNTQGNL